MYRRLFCLLATIALLALGPAAAAAPPAGGCNTTGGFEAISATGAETADLNGDGIICAKFLRGAELGDITIVVDNNMPA